MTTLGLGLDFSALFLDILWLFPYIFPSSSLSLPSLFIDIPERDFVFSLFLFHRHSLPFDMGFSNIREKLVGWPYLDPRQIGYP